MSEVVLDAWGRADKLFEERVRVRGLLEAQPELDDVLVRNDLKCADNTLIEVTHATLYDELPERLQMLKC